MEKAVKGETAGKHAIDNFHVGNKLRETEDAKAKGSRRESLERSTKPEVKRCKRHLALEISLYNPLKISQHVFFRESHFMKARARLFDHLK